jgi:hypothetical protein
MPEEFSTPRTNLAVSTNGYSVKVDPNGGVIYVDSEGEISIDTEWFSRPALHIAVYRESPSNKGLEGKNSVRVNLIFDRIFKALRYLGHDFKCL